jgi:hypothetical protein
MAPVANETGRDCRCLPHCATGHSRNLRRPRAVASARAAHGPAEWKTHSGPEAGSPAPTRPHALVRFAHLAAGSTFTTRELHPDTLAGLECAADQYRLASLRYDLSKLRAKGLVEKVPHSRRYRLLPQGYSICLVFLKLFERIYAPLTAGLLQPFAGDAQFQKRHQLDRLYQRVVDDLETLITAVGLKVAA